MHLAEGNARNDRELRGPRSGGNRPSSHLPASSRRSCVAATSPSIRWRRVPPPLRRSSTAPRLTNNISWRLCHRSAVWAGPTTSPACAPPWYRDPRGIASWWRKRAAAETCAAPTGCPAMGRGDRRQRPPDHVPLDLRLRIGRDPAERSALLQIPALTVCGKDEAASLGPSATRGKECSN